MKKRVLILSTSPRQGGNSDALAASFAEGARSAVPPMCWSLPPPSISTKCLDR